MAEVAIVFGCGVAVGIAITGGILALGILGHVAARVSELLDKDDE